MTAKSPSAVDSQDTAPDALAEGEVVLRDESDEIIDNLKRQLGALGEQLSASNERERSADSMQRELAPHIASRLQVPVEELTSRLERLIEQASDPELRTELEHCRGTAFFLFDTFQRIHDKHEELTESLSAGEVELSLTEFREHLEASLHQRVVPVRVTAAEDLPLRLTVAHRSVVTVLATLADLAMDLFGEPGTLHLSRQATLGGEGEQGEQLSLVMASPEPWQGVESGDAVSTGVIRSGVRSRAVVDLLYVEKIIEMRGGRLEFYRLQGRVHGFAVSLPLAASA